MNEHKKRTNKLWMRIGIVALCLVMAFGTTVTIMASSFNGDLDGDGQITAYDAQLLAEYQAGHRDLDPATVIGLTVRGIIDRVLGRIVDEPAEEPSLADGIEKTFEVTAEDGVVTKTETFEFGIVTVTVPEGAKVNGTELTVTVKQKDASEGGITLEDGQELLPLDIHVEGVAADNTAPIIISVAEALDAGMNLGNLTLYHVENGVANPMTQVMDAAELTAHNSFYYDPATGNITVAMATFSEVAMVSDSDAPWNGAIANEFAGGDGTENDPYIIANADQLAYMSQLVSGDEAAAEAHYKLISNVNMNGDVAQKNDRRDLMFYPIGYWAKQVDENGVALKNSAGEEYYGRGNTFTGVFDGNGNTIANIYQNTWLMDGTYDYGYWNTAMGLFGAVYGTTIKNLTIDNFQCDGETAPVGCIATYAGGPDMLFENIQLTNCNPRTYNVACGGIAGYNYNSTSGTADKITFRNITVDQTNKISALWGSYGVSGGSLLGRLRENSRHDGTNNDGQFNHVVMENCHMATVMDVNNDCCSNYQWYLYCYAGMVIGTVDYIDEVPGVGIEDVVTATGCTVTYGDWNRYWYCELVKNTIASYTHDHQFGRLTEIDSLSEIQDENGNWTKEGGFVTIDEDNNVECYHIFKNSAGELYRHYHDVKDETNPEVYETTDVNGDGVIDSNLLKEDHQRYFIPFNQLWIGYNRGCKPMYEFEGIEIVEGGTVKSSTKFVAKADASVETDATVKLSDLFTSVEGANISQSTVNVFVSPVGEDSTVAAEFNRDNSNWGDGTLSFTGEGAAKIVITDYFYCTETVLYVTVGDKQPVEKFVATDKTEFSTKTVTLGELFDANDDAEIDAEKITVSFDGGITAEYVANEADWKQGTITFDGNAGQVTVTITDGDLCIPATTTLTLTKVEKFSKLFTNTGFTYRVGDTGAVALQYLFAAKEGATIGAVDVTIENVSGTASGTYTSNAAWASGTIQFSGAGKVTVTITDNDYCIPTELTLEVVDATNVTSATNATANNVVLLKNCGFSSLEVSGGYTLYGNGFTLTCGSDSVAADLGYSFVTLNNGTLDNVQIVCPNFDYAALYKSNLTSSDNRSNTDSSGKTRYYNARSGVMVSGNSQILNSRISGGRAAVNVAGGNLLIDNSRIELGAVANILVGAANSLTLRDVTLVQKPTKSTYNNPSKTLMGFSVLYMCDANGKATPTKLEGELIQWAWVNESDAQYVPSMGEDIVSQVLKQEKFLHDIDEDGTNESLNLGFAYMPEDTENEVSSPDNITDERVNKAAVPYEMQDVKIQISILSTTVYVYSYVNTEGTDEAIQKESQYESNKYGDIIAISYSDTADGLVAGKSFGTDGWVYELNVDLDKQSGYALDFSKLSMSVNGEIVTDYKVNGAAKPTSPVAVTAGGVTYTLTATVNGVEYTAYYKVTGTETSKESPSLVASNYEAGLCVASSKGGTWHGAAPALKGIQIKYWSVAEKQYKTINLADYTPTSKGQLNGTNTTWTYSPDNGDFTLTLTGGQVHSSNNVYAMPVCVEDNGTYTLYFVAAKSSGLVNSGNSARTIPVTYTFKDNNNGDVLTFSHTWSVAEDQDNEYSYSDLCSGTLTKLEDSGGCVTGDTLITLADGTKKRADQITYNDELLVWDFFKGEYTSAVPSAIYNYGEKTYKVTNLKFSDGTVVKMIAEHEFFDVKANSFVYICEDNVQEFVGHRFLKTSGDQYTSVILTSYEFTEEYTGSYTILTAEHYNCFSEDMFSLTADPSYKCETFFRIFEVGEGMKFDEAKMQADIAKYGLYTYEDYAAYVTYEEFVAFGGAYFKILVGKGLLEFEDILQAVATYAP